MKKNLRELCSENKKLIVPIIVIILILIMLIIVINFSKNTPSLKKETIKTTLTLFGDTNITLNLKEAYEEPGFYAITETGVLRTKEVTVTNNIDIEIPGTYVVTYQIDDIVKTRTVEVLSANPIEEEETLTLTLKGEKVLNLSIGENYTEPGFEAYDNKGNDLSKEVTIDGLVDTNKAGTYTLTYLLENKKVIRTIIVLDDRLTITLTPNTTNYTDIVTLNIVVQGNNFKSLIMPNQKESKEKITNYNIDSNGTFTFKALNENDKAFTQTITIQNIDKTAPNASCTATINSNNTTTINIIAEDKEAGINNYVYYDDGSVIMNTTTSSFTYNKKTSSNVYVRVYDKAKNEKYAYCTLTDNSKADRTLNPIILIGDSRTVGMCSSCNYCKGDKVIAKGGMSYTWMVDTAIPEVNSYLKKHPDKSYNIFILLGVNGIGSSSSSGKNVANRYYKKVLELAQNKWQDQYIYYVSVNKVLSSGTNTAVKAFNQNMKNQIAEANRENLNYCDTYSKVTINSSNTYSDGVHYKCSAYKNIYNALKTCL